MTNYLFHVKVTGTYVHISEMTETKLRELRDSISRLLEINGSPSAIIPSLDYRDKDLELQFIRHKIAPTILDPAPASSVPPLKPLPEDIPPAEGYDILRSQGAPFEQ